MTLCLANWSYGRTPGGLKRAGEAQQPLKFRVSPRLTWGQVLGKFDLAFSHMIQRDDSSEIRGKRRAKSRSTSGDNQPLQNHEIRNSPPWKIWDSLLLPGCNPPPLVVFSPRKRSLYRVTSIGDFKLLRRGSDRGLMKRRRGYAEFAPGPQSFEIILLESRDIATCWMAWNRRHSRPNVALSEHGNLRQQR